MLSQIYARLRDGFRSGKSKNIEYRKYQLLQLGYMIQDNMKRFEEALAADLGRPPFESHLCAQISFVVILHTLMPLLLTQPRNWCLYHGSSYRLVRC